MRHYHHSGVNLTLGGLHKALRALEDRVEDLANGRQAAEQWAGTERRNDSAFSDKQVERIKGLFDERTEVHAGRAFLKLILWVAGAAAAGAGTILIAYLKLKA